MRVVAGQELVKRYVSQPGLNNIFCSDDFIVQGLSNVDVISKSGKTIAMIEGKVFASRSDANSMNVIGNFHADVESLIAKFNMEDCIDVLEGRYVLIKINPDGGFDLGCDKFGQIDMYYQRVDGGVVFATDLSLLPIAVQRDEYDQVALAHTLGVYGYRPAKRHTFYRNVRRLGVREIAKWKATTSELSFVEAPFVPLQTSEYGSEKLREYSDILLDAIEIRSSKNENIIYLSSGWDSTSILAGLVKIHGPSKVKAVIGRMKYAERSGVINQFELDRAKAVADYFGVKLDIVEFNYWERGPELLERLGPFMRSNMLASMTLFNHEILAEYVSAISSGGAVFAGEISDGVHNLGFSQFVTMFHKDLGFREYSDKMASYLFGPTFLESLEDNKFSDDSVYNLLRDRLTGNIFDELDYNSNTAAGHLFASFFLRSNRIPLWSLKNVKILTSEGRERYTNEMESIYLSRPSADANKDTLYSWYLHLYNSFHWQSSTVATLAATLGKYGLDLSLPFWDSRLQEFLSAMPESWGRGLDLNPTKYPLKWMLEHCIDYPLHLQVGPHSYIYDVDPSFSHGAEFMYGSAFTPCFKKRLAAREYKHILSEDIFDLNYIDDVVSKYTQGVESSGSELNDVMAINWLMTMGWY